MPETTFELPKIGDKKKLNRNTVIEYEKTIQEITLKFQIIEDERANGHQDCPKCGYNHHNGLWTGTASKQTGRYKNSSFFFTRCPICDHEDIFE